MLQEQVVLQRATMMGVATHKRILIPTYSEVVPDIGGSPCTTASSDQGNHSPHPVAHHPTIPSACCSTEMAEIVLFAPILPYFSDIDLDDFTSGLPRAIKISNGAYGGTFSGSPLEYLVNCIGQTISKNIPQDLSLLFFPVPRTTTSQ
jgi:hypothetical protein